MMKQTTKKLSQANSNNAGQGFRKEMSSNSINEASPKIPGLTSTFQKAKNNNSFNQKRQTGGK